MTNKYDLIKDYSRAVETIESTQEIKILLSKYFSEQLNILKLAEIEMKNEYLGSELSYINSIILENSSDLERLNITARRTTTCLCCLNRGEDCPFHIPGDYEDTPNDKPLCNLIDKVKSKLTHIWFDSYSFYYDYMDGKINILNTLAQCSNLRVFRAIDCNIYTYTIIDFLKKVNSLEYLDLRNNMIGYQKESDQQHEEDAKDESLLDFIDGLHNQKSLKWLDLRGNLNLTSEENSDFIYLLLKKIGKQLDYLALPENESSKKSNYSCFKNPIKFSEFPLPSESKELNWRDDKGEEIYKLFINKLKSTNAAYVDSKTLRSIFKDLFFLALTDKNVSVDVEKLFILNDFDFCCCCADSFMENPHGRGLNNNPLAPSFNEVFELIKSIKFDQLYITKLDNDCIEEPHLYENEYFINEAEYITNTFIDLKDQQRSLECITVSNSFLSHNHFIKIFPFVSCMTNLLMLDFYNSHMLDSTFKYFSLVCLKNLLLEYIGLPTGYRSSFKYIFESLSLLRNMKYVNGVEINQNDEKLLFTYINKSNHKEAMLKEVNFYNNSIKNYKKKLIKVVKFNISFQKLK